MTRNKSGEIWVVIIAAFLIIAGLVLGYFYLFTDDFLFFTERQQNKLTDKKTVHFYKNPQISIEKVGLKVFYVVPTDRKDNIGTSWKETIKNAFNKITRFHALQLRGLSELNYGIFPEPVILENEESFYNTTSTYRGNPRGLVSIAEEIDKRVFRAGGDLYSEKFAKFEQGEYPVFGLVYEGVGASGGVIYDTVEGETEQDIAKRLGVPESVVYIVDVDAARGFFLLNYEFLKDESFSIFGPTYLYHEFAHSFGLPDRDKQSEAPLTNDIMGLGRKDPIEVMYIDKYMLKDLGVLE